MKKKIQLAVGSWQLAVLSLRESCNQFSKQSFSAVNFSKVSNFGKVFCASIFIVSLFTFILSLFTSCTDEDFTPKERGYYRLSFPEHEYKTFAPEYCPFSFEYPVYATISRDSVFLDTIPENPCWLNINFPEWNGAIYISYKEITKEQPLDKLINDAHVLTYKHTVKASSIDESVINSKNKVYGLYYEVAGNAASNIQFFATDSFNHFIRGSLYFNNRPNVDSLKPVISFVASDIRHLIGTLKWK